MTFASTITNLRRELGLTQAGLAALLHVDKQSVSNWETGRNEPWPARQVEIIGLLRGAPGSRASQNTAERDPPVTSGSTGAPRRRSISARILEP